MKNKILGLLGLNILLLILLTGAVSAVTLAEWSLTTDGSAITTTGVSAGSFTNSSAISGFAFSPNGAHASGWTTVMSVDTTEYFQITIAPSSGYDLSITGLNFGIWGSTPNSPNKTQIRWDTNSGFSSPTILDTYDVNTTEQLFNKTISISVSNGETLYIRFYGYSAVLGAGELYITDNTLNIQGTVTGSTSDDPQEIQSCIDVENPGELKVKGIDFTNKGMSQNKGLSYTKFGDDNEWFPLDEIEVDIEIENKGDDDVDDIEVEWGIYDTQKNQWIIELEDEKDFNLKDDDEETLTISFQLEEDLDVDLDELDDGDHYRFYVIATGTVDDTGSPQTCVSDYELAEIIIESDFVVLYNIEYPETVMCGGTVQITADVWNIGDEDQDEVSVDLVGKGLGLDKTTLIGDIDAFDNDKFSLTFTVPKDAEEKTYTLNFEVWDEDNDVYENDFDEDESEFFLPLKVEGNCAVVDSGILISASLESEAKAGKEMVMSVLLTNTADVTRSFTMEVSGYDAWAELSELPGLLTLNADSVGEVFLKIDLKKGISGEQTFLILVYSDNKLIATQPVSVNIESARPFLGITGLVTTDNAYLWGIGLLNIILIVIIILVAVRIARRK